MRPDPGRTFLLAATMPVWLVCYFAWFCGMLIWCLIYAAFTGKEFLDR